MIPYSTVNYIFGAPRSGKTTLLAKLSRYFLKQGRRVYSNFPLKDVIEISDEELGYFDFGENAVLLLDECGISYNNRDAFSKKALMSDPDRLRYWKLIGHYKATVFVASQGWNDIDLKIRNLSTHYIYIKKCIIPGFTLIKPVYKHCDIDENTHEPTDYYSFALFFEWKLLLRRRYYKYFDSYECPTLQPYPITIPKIITRQGRRYYESKPVPKKFRFLNPLHKRDLSPKGTAEHSDAV